MTFEDKAQVLIKKWESTTFWTEDEPRAALQSLIVDGLKAATLAERERCEKEAEELKYEAPTSIKHFSYNKACEEIIAAIRKGEGV
jgi:uncharacterized protein YhfF